MKILIVKTSSLGDIVQAFPVASYLHRLFPKAEIDWVAKTPYLDLLRSHPLIHRALQAKDIKKSTYDLLLDLQGNIKSGLITARAKAQEKIGFTFRQAPEWPNALFTTKRYPINLNEPISKQYLSLAHSHFSNTSLEADFKVDLKVSEKELEWVEEKLRGSSSPRLMICLGSAWENKKLSLQTWKEFLGRIQKEVSSHFFFVWGNEKEKTEAEILNLFFSDSSSLLPHMRLPVWQRMMARMDAVLSVDSGALHLAATAGTRTFSFFGPSSAQVYKPAGERHGAFEGDCPYGVAFTKRCPKLRTCSTGSCLKDISSEALYSRFIEWFASR